MSKRIVTKKKTASLSGGKISLRKGVSKKKTTATGREKRGQPPINGSDIVNK